MNRKKFINLLIQESKENIKKIEHRIDVINTEIDAIISTQDTLYSLLKPKIHKKIDYIISKKFKEIKKLMASLKVEKNIINRLEGGKE